MHIAQLKISYDRGLAHNDDRDLGVNGVGRGFVTAENKIIRGLGTHYKSQQEMEEVKLKDAEAHRVRNEFRKRFLVTPLDGVYMVEKPGAAKAFISSLAVRDDVRVSVYEFELQSTGPLDTTAISEWAARVRSQIAGISLGRSKEADEDGLKAIEFLARCPLLNKDTGARIKELVGAVRDQKITRIEMKRSLEKLDVKIEAMHIEPRRMAKITKEVA